MKTFRVIPAVSEFLIFVSTCTLRNPATQAMNAFKTLAMGGTADFEPWFSVIALFSSGILAFGAAVFLFSWDSRNTTRRGHAILALVFLLPFVISILIG